MRTIDSKKEEGAWYDCENGCGRKVFRQRMREGHQILCPKCYQDKANAAAAEKKRQSKKKAEENKEAIKLKEKEFFCSECGAELVGRKRSARPGKKMLCSNCKSALRDELGYYGQPEVQAVNPTKAPRCPECGEIDLLNCTSLKDGKTKICQVCYDKQISARDQAEWNQRHPDGTKDIPFGSMQPITSTSDFQTDSQIKSEDLLCEECGAKLKRQRKANQGTQLLCNKCRMEKYRFNSDNQEECSSCHQIRHVDTRMENGDPLCATCASRARRNLPLIPESKICSCGKRLAHHNRSGLCQEGTTKQREIVEKEKKYCDCGALLSPQNKTGKCRKCFVQEAHRIQKEKRGSKNIAIATQNLETNKTIVDLNPISQDKISEKSNESAMSRDKFHELFVEKGARSSLEKDDDSKIVDGETGIVIKVKKKRISKVNPQELDTSQVFYTPEEIRARMQKKSRENGDANSIHRTKRMEKCPGCKAFSYLDYASPVTGEWICLECFEKQTRACQDQTDPAKRKELFPYFKGPLIIKGSKLS